MQKTKIIIFSYLFIIFTVFIVFICGCSTQSDDITENSPSIILTSDVSTSEEENTTETTETSTSIETAFEIETAFGVIEILVFNIGKADAILITTENHTVMIDTGENKHGLEIADYLLSRDITEIDYLIITHFHKDHVGGAGAIINNLTVKEVIVPNYGKESKHYNRFAAAMNESGIEQNILKETLKFTLDNTEFTVYPPQQEYYYYSDGSTAEDDDEYDEDENEENEDEDDDENINIINENNFSLVVNITHGNNNFLFTGDAKAQRLKELFFIEDIVNTRYDFLKVPHHGQSNKRSAEFIYAIMPKYAVITCSLKNPADNNIVAALEDVGADIYFTPNGNVYCKSNGYSLIMAYE